MRNFLTVFFMLTLSFFITSAEMIKFEDVKKAITGTSPDEIRISFEQIKNKTMQKETGWVYSVKNYNDTEDIVYVEMDQPAKDFSKNKPDLYFFIDKKFSKRLREYQIIYFSGVFYKYDYLQHLIELKDVFLSGIMR